MRNFIILINIITINKKKIGTQRELEPRYIATRSTNRASSTFSQFIQWIKNADFYGVLRC